MNHHITFFAAVFALLLLFALPSLSGAIGQDWQKEYGLKLLAVSNEGGGTTARLYLKVVDGTGNVFLESGTETRIDTRISMKLAKEIACQSIPDFSEKCDALDFFYRMEANASLIGGPSAGAAAAALAIAAVGNDKINQSVAVTGTITSGAMIGAVGGLKEKIDAASSAGISQVLIPGGERYSQDGNLTVDLVKYGSSLGIGVVEVKTVDDALLYLTGRNYSVKEAPLEIDPHYSAVMGVLSGELCGRSSMLSAKISDDTLSSAENGLLANGGNASMTGNLSDVLKEARNQTLEGFSEKENGSHYTAASMCFSANVRYSYLLLLGENMSPSDALLHLNLTAAEAGKFSVPAAGTLAGLQVRGTVNERISETSNLINLGIADFGKGNYADGIYSLAFAKERLGSAVAWSRFLTSSFANNSRQVPAEKYADLLREGCITRLQESEERAQYLGVYLPGVLNSETELGPAYAYLRSSDYSSCIYRASLATAKVNAMLSALGGNDNLTLLVGEKLGAAKKSIVRQTMKGEFPIVSYSYYEYARALEAENPASALLFAEYAIELSNLDVYLKPSPAKAGLQPSGKIAHILIGIAIGFVAALVFAFSMKHPHRRKKRIIVRSRKK